MVHQVDEQNCYEELIDEKGINYRGCQTKTRSGLTCQDWDSEVPHKNVFETKYDLGENPRNYCRNTDDSETIWCITTDPNVYWEYCDPINFEKQKPPTCKFQKNTMGNKSNKAVSETAQTEE